MSAITNLNQNLSPATQPPVNRDYLNAAKLDAMMGFAFGVVLTRDNRAYPELCHRPDQFVKPIDAKSNLITMGVCTVAGAIYGVVEEFFKGCL